MRVTHSPTPLPRLFSGIPRWGDLIRAEGRIRLTGRSRLHAKVLLFAKNIELRRFWVNALGSDGASRNTLGIVTSMGYEVISNVGTPQERSRMEVDPRYFAVIGLIQGHTTPEIIAHEAGHAAFAFAKRQKRNLWLPRGAFDEEDICYPLGKLAAGIAELVAAWELEIKV
jgi:hypothetical protein